MTKHFLTATLLLIILCSPPVTLAAEPARSDRNAKTPTKAKREPLQLVPGMPETRVQELLGRPDQVKPFAAPEGNATVWMYRRVLGHRIDMVEPTVQEVIVFQACGSCSKRGPINQPVSQPQRITIELNTRLLFVDGELVAWKQFRTEQARGR